MRKFKDYFWTNTIRLFSYVSILIFIVIVLYIFINSLPALTKLGLNMFDPKSTWRPTSETPSYGLIPIICGTIFVSFYAVILALIFGYILAIFVSFYTKKMISDIVLMMTDVLAGLPSVIFGFIGLSLLAYTFVNIFKLSKGQCVLLAILILAIMLLPFIVSNCYEQIELIKKEYLANALSLGLSKEYVIVKIILPLSKNAILSSIMLAFGRALGETMAVMMLIGNSPIYPSFLKRSQTIAGLTALELGSIEYGSLHLSVLYVANLVLLLLLLISYLLGYIFGKLVKKYD